MSQRVLFIEDDFMTIDPLVSHLGIRGHAVRVSDAVHDAIELLMWEDFDVIFLDVMLPPGEIFGLEETADGRYTGLRLLEMIRSDSRFERNRNTRIALVTNWREEPQVDEVAARLRVPLLQKPLALSTVEEFVEHDC